MRTNLYFFILIATVLISCANNKQSEDKNMSAITFNHRQAEAMTAISAHEAIGDTDRLSLAINNGLEAGLTVNQIKEALSQLYAYTGFPRSLNALGVLQSVIDERRTNGMSVTEGTDATPLGKDYDALKEGIRVQTKLVGQPFNYAFAPQTDYYLKAHLFGDIFARDILTYAERELVTVSALSALEGTESQLLAHVNGARNMGVPDELLLAIPPTLNKHVNQQAALRASKAISKVLGTTDELLLYVNNAVDLKSRWPKGKPNDAYAMYFTGHSYLNPLEGGVACVTFEPRCRNYWHIHHGAVQVLVCVYGRGWYQQWGEKAIPLTEGTVIAIPEGVKHWHGAARGSWMQHLAYHTEQQPDATTEWLEAVSDDIYDKLP
ncbi:MAG TPA: carboxymuconolactone decarboxylase [Bacteroidales bacterium]|nr:carboxymuconolactone decarboxylase [Bacteroidales bacterium]